VIALTPALSRKREREKHAAAGEQSLALSAGENATACHREHSLAPVFGGEG
jgi:hypothetical protein